jgi:membrane-bound lytic murein transglycosylase F
MRIYWANPFRNGIKIVLLLVSITVIGLLVAHGFEWRSHWDQIKVRGKLIVAVRESEGIYWANGQEINGFEHDLLADIEQHLNIPIQIFAVRDMDDLYRALAVGAVDMALPGTSENMLNNALHLPYSTTQIGLVQSKNEPPAIDNFRTGVLDPIAHKDAVNLVLNSLSNGSAVYEHGRISAELFTLIEMNELEQVIVDERDFQLQQNACPDLRFTPLDIPNRNINVLFHPKEDGTLYDKIEESLTDIRESGLLVQIHDRYFGDALEFNYVDNLTFEKHLKLRLPTFEELFRTYAQQYGMDWRLLAAIAYQESHWRANARSPTGVRGLMMITLNTAAEVGITNRLDPAQSTKAGAQYLTTLKSRIPARITEPDRTWFALASYNVGAGHLEDARKITDLLEGDPDRWIDVRKHLPKLALKDYYPWTKHGYARGAEPVVYVANIRRFYEKLKKIYPETSESIEPDRLDQLPNAEVPLFPGQ